MARNGRDLFNPDGEAIGTILVGVTDGSYYNGPSTFSPVPCSRHLLHLVFLRRKIVSRPIIIQLLDR